MQHLVGFPSSLLNSVMWESVHLIVSYSQSENSELGRVLQSNRTSRMDIVIGIVVAVAVNRCIYLL